MTRTIIALLTALLVFNAAAQSDDMPRNQTAQSAELKYTKETKLRYLLFLLAVVVRRHTFRREVELVETHSIECRPRSGSNEELFVEADGEVLGLLPVKLEVVPHSLTLLVPPGIHP